MPQREHREMHTVGVRQGKVIGMQWLILALILVAAYNATFSMEGQKLRWSIPIYWTLAACYWLIKATETMV